MQELRLNKCDRCGEQAKAFLPYGPHRLCSWHFIDFFERRVKRATATAKMIQHGEKIAVGVSGGKDSMATLHLLHKFFGKTNELEAIMIDEGIKGYRDKALEIGVAYCKGHGIKYHVVKYEDELGLDMNEVMGKIHADRTIGTTCSFCGVFRRNFLNSKALEIGADKLATGHNLDDECQSIAMSLFDNELTGIARSSESMEKRHEAMVPRIKPLYETPEKEIIAYTALIGLEHYSEECCPYSWMAKRNYYRKMLNELEDKFPGTKHKIIQMHRKLRPLLREHDMQNSEPLGKCLVCGNPSAGEKCSVCRQLEKLRSPSAKPAQAQSMKKESGLSCAVTKANL